MRKRMIYFIIGILALWGFLQIAKPLFPDWLRIILNANPKHLKDAVNLAKDTYNYDKE